MKVLIVGGTGMIGGQAALFLERQGHDVTLSARAAPPEGSALTRFPVLIGSYLEQTISSKDLSTFDAVVFGAGNDPRNLNGGADDYDHWRRVNSLGVPAFFAKAREAGVKFAVNIGSFYPQAAPELVAKSAYVRSRLEADEGVRALAREAFRVCSVNAPYVVGTRAGARKGGMFFFVRYARGEIEGAPVCAPPGGVNYISVRSLCEAIGGALDRGESGRAYLVGDENLSFQDFLGGFYKAVGRTETPSLCDGPNPVMPPSVAGPGGEIYFEPDPAEVATLSYTRNDIDRAIREIVSLYDGGVAG